MSEIISPITSMPSVHVIFKSHQGCEQKEAIHQRADFKFVFGANTTTLNLIGQVMGFHLSNTLHFSFIEPLVVALFLLETRESCDLGMTDCLMTIY